MVRNSLLLSLSNFINLIIYHEIMPIDSSNYNAHMESFNNLLEK